MTKQPARYFRVTFFGSLGLVLAVALSGCSSFLAEGTSAGAGIAGVTIADRMTDNAAVATGIGLGVQAVANAGLQYAQRKTRGEEHDAIVRAAASLNEGEVGEWAVIHPLPLEPDSQGKVTVSRLIGGVGLACKEIVFSHAPMSAVNPLLDSEFFVAIICKNPDGWHWATAEPATARWGALQ